MNKDVRFMDDDILWRMNVTCFSFIDRSKLTDHFPLMGALQTSVVHLSNCRFFMNMHLILADFLMLFCHISRGMMLHLLADFHPFFQHIYIF